MSITVSAAFTAAEIADIAQVATRVYIVRGDYAATAAGSTATASSTDASGNFPASGAIDGDHTEINMGAASTADNGVGLSSWKSSATPSGGAPQTLEIDFNATRTFNQVKVYNYSGDPLTLYTVQYWNGSTWVDFAGNAYSGYTGGLDNYDFSAAGTTYTATKIRLHITGTTNSDAAQVVAVEVYYKQDVTDRATSVKTDRQRDWKQVNPMAAAATLIFDNSDRFFSPKHVPTAAETAAGFFNSELTTDLGIVVQFGFWYGGSPYYALGYGLRGYGDGPFDQTSYPTSSSPELVTNFVGTIDSIRSNSLSGTCTITGRDGMKALLNQTWSTRLKQNIDIGAAIQYMLNICNVSNYEMSVDTTGIILPYFFVYEQSAFTTVQQLVQATGNAALWFDENNTATFKDYLLSSSNSHTDFVFVTKATSSFATAYQNPTVTNTGGLLTVYSNGVQATAADIASATLTGWTFTMSSQAGDESRVFFMGQDLGTPGNPSVTPNGYCLRLASGTAILAKLVGGAGTNLTGSFTLANNSSVTILRADNGAGSFNFYVFVNGVLAGTATDNAFTTSTYFVVWSCGLISGNSTVTLTNIGLMNSVYSTAVSAGTLTVTATSIDQSASITSEGNLAVGFAPANAPITFQTRTSPDNSTWSAYTSVTLNSTTQQGSIPSTTQRYIQYRFSFSVGSGIPLWSVFYAITSWNLTSAAAGARTLAYNSNLCDVTEELSESLGGDSSIVNYFEVLSAPLILTGTTSDTQWQATSGYPPQKVSSTYPMVVSTGTITLQAVVPGGMDTSLMTGTNPSAVAITWGTATGSIAITYIHPTKPILTLTVTGAGTITDLRLIGQAFSNLQTPINAKAGDATSQTVHKRRTQQIQNDYIVVPAVAQLIANAQLTLYLSPADVVDGPEVLLTPTLQLADPVVFSDYNLDLTTQQWCLSGITHEITKDSSADTATIKTSVKALYLSAN